MRQTLIQGLSLAEQLAALPFKAVREAISDLPIHRRPIGEVIDESLLLAGDVVRLPFKAASALLAEWQPQPSLAERVARLEQRLGTTDTGEAPSQ